MSANKTAKLQLNQWAATDSFLREEFNSDNSKVDAAVGLLQSERIKFGTYTGNWNFDAVTQVEVGFSPRAVFVTAKGCNLYDNGGLVLRDAPYMCGKNFVCRMTPTGFEVCTRNQGGDYHARPALGTGIQYTYIAFG